MTLIMKIHVLVLCIVYVNIVDTDKDKCLGDM